MRFDGNFTVFQDDDRIRVVDIFHVAQDAMTASGYLASGTSLPHQLVVHPDFSSVRLGGRESASKHEACRYNHTIN
jgi:hypothetical protein